MPGDGGRTPIHWAVLAGPIGIAQCVARFFGRGCVQMLSVNYTDLASGTRVQLVGGSRGYRTECNLPGFIHHDRLDRPQHASRGASRRASERRDDRRSRFRLRAGLVFRTGDVVLDTVVDMRD